MNEHEPWTLTWIDNYVKAWLVISAFIASYYLIGWGIIKITGWILSLGG